MDNFYIWWRRVLSTAMFFTLLAPIAPAAEIILRDRAQVETGIVRLADVAELSGASTAIDTLSQIELFPAPAVGSRRFLRIRELQDMLADRQVNLLDNRLSGASVVEIVNARPIAKATPAVNINTTRATKEIRTALVSYLRQFAGKQDMFDVIVAANSETAMALQAADYRFDVRGGQQPWVGRQRFEIVPEGQAEPIAVDVEVTKSPVIVVAVRTVSRGAMVQASDVELVPQTNQRPIDGVLSRIEDVVGREAPQGLAVGQIVTNKTVQAQRLIQKGNIVTVYARSSGLKVRTTARAKEDGSLGGVIAVESVLNRQAFFARVVGIDEVEVYARAIEASTGDSAGVASR